MNEKSVRAIAAMMRSVSRMVGVPILWRRAHSGGGVKVQRILTEELYHHRNDYCMAVKSRRNLERKCQMQESVKLADASREVGRAFLKTCHAGVVEWVVPLLHNGRYEGVLILGPFRRKNDRCPYGGFSDLHRSLPIYERRTIARIQPILAVLAEHILNLEAAASSKPTRRVRDERIARALEYMTAHYAEALTLADVAHHCGLSRSRFGHLFTEVCGESFSTRLSRVRVWETGALLANSSLTLSEIAQEVGFSDQSHLGAVFKRFTGQTPRGYRLKAQAKQEA